MKLSPEELALAKRLLERNARMNVRYAERREFQRRFPQHKAPEHDDNPYMPTGCRAPFFESQRQYEGFSPD